MLFPRLFTLFFLARSSMLHWCACPNETPPPQGRNSYWLCGLVWWCDFYQWKVHDFWCSLKVSAVHVQMSDAVTKTCWLAFVVINTSHAPDFQVRIFILLILNKASEHPMLYIYIGHAIYIYICLWTLISIGSTRNYNQPIQHFNSALWCIVHNSTTDVSNVFLN